MAATVRASASVRFDACAPGHPPAPASAIRTRRSWSGSLAGQPRTSRWQGWRTCVGRVDRRRGRHGSVAGSTGGASVSRRLVVDSWVRAPRLSLVAVATLTVFLLGTLIPPFAEAAVASVVYHGSRYRPYVALTIDDGYNSANCRRIADILRAKNVPATYSHMPVSSMAHRRPGATSRRVASGSATTRCRTRS